MDAVQMNVRMDRELKASGDGVFAGIGLSPTEAVRRLWGFASRNRSNRKAVAELMESLRDPDEVRQEQDERARRLAEADAWLEDFQKLVRDYCEMIGVYFDNLPPLTDEERRQMKEEMYDEKYAEWLGLA